MSRLLAPMAVSSVRHNVDVRLNRCSTTVDSAIAGKTANDSTKRIFSTDYASHNAGVFTRNPTCWAAGFDLTPISPWNSREGYARGGILVTPRHFICAKHFHLTPGIVVRFVTADNIVVDRTITAVLPVSDTDSVSGGILMADFQVCLLESDVPPTISFAKVPSVNTTNRADVRGIGNNAVASLFTDQEEKIMVAEWYIYGSQKIPFEGTKRFEFYEPVVGYDSGNPLCLVDGTQLIMYTVFTGPGGGYPIASYINQINAAILYLGNGNGYTLTQY